jgi:hypothetical protein
MSIWLRPFSQAFTVTEATPTRRGIGVEQTSSTGFIGTTEAEASHLGATVEII